MGKDTKILLMLVAVSLFAIVVVVSDSFAGCWESNEPNCFLNKLGEKYEAQMFSPDVEITVVNEPSVSEQLHMIRMGRAMDDLEVRTSRRNNLSLRTPLEVALGLNFHVE